MDTTASLLLPPASSTTAQYVDPLFTFLIWMSAFFFVLIVGLMTYFVIKYKRGKTIPGKIAGPTHNTALEITWIVIPSILVLIIFAWGFRGFIRMSVAPANAMEIKVTGQKWFWSFDYPDGATAINELVVPVGKPVKLLMSSQDVIHSFYVPAFRVKKDVLPNRYSIVWFEATRTGEFNLFCAEYCGEQHSQMIGKIKVMSELDYLSWLESASTAGEGMTAAEYGKKLYTSKACYTCHSIDGTPGNGPSFMDRFGGEVTLNDGSKVTMDENYVRESILNPMAKIAGGFQPIMPTFQGLLKDREIDALVAFIKSLGEQQDSTETLTGAGHE